MSCSVTSKLLKKWGALLKDVVLSEVFYFCLRSSCARFVDLSAYMQILFLRTLPEFWLQFLCFSQICASLCCSWMYELQFWVGKDERNASILIWTASNYWKIRSVRCFQVYSQSVVKHSWSAACKILRHPQARQRISGAVVQKSARAQFELNSLVKTLRS